LSVLEVTRVDPGAHGDAALVAQLCAVVNRSYEVGERGLWLEGATRTQPAEVAQAIGDGEALVARDDGRVVGYARLWRREARVAALGPVAIAPEHWGRGAGRELVRYGEQLALETGVQTLQLNLLMPRNGAHAHKDALRDWYLRLGYDIVETVPFEELAPLLAPDLAVPCHVLIFRKALA
jgi:GNAT superfamily N-acetyltransferase